MKILLLLALVALVKGDTYVPGTPGAPWSSEVASIIRNKLFQLWRTDVYPSNVKQFDQMVHGKNGNPGFTDYLHEDDMRLSKIDCDINNDQCRSSWLTGVRLDDIAFTPSKAMRLAFHDCQPYVDGSGGCDGCINLDVNVAENDVLQHSVAILEKLYNEADYPEDAPTLEKSPKDLGISRADLWAFAGVLALDESSRRSRAYCDSFNVNLTCGDFSPCFVSFPEKFDTLFKTGRIDCVSDSTDDKKQYLAPLSEDSPHAVANGVQTADYFLKNFGLTARESLALMGAHTIGKFSTFHTHIDYAWVRARGGMRHKVLNNEYYKTLVADPGHVKDGYCVGKLDGSPATKQWHVFANLFEDTWPQPIPGSDWKQKPRRFLWHHEVTRGPNCHTLDEDGTFKGMQTPWIDSGKQKDIFIKLVGDLKSYAQGKGFDSMYDYCCDLQRNGQNDEKCNQAVQNRIRHLASDVGFYFKFDFKNGLPIGCEGIERGFKEMGKTPNKWGWYFAGEIPGPADCPKQTDVRERINNNGKRVGKHIYRTVEEYAKNLDTWLTDFVNVWAKMSQNRNTNLVDGPKDILTSRCCIHSSVKYNKGVKLSEFKAESALDCQSQCKDTNGCNWFVYASHTKNCQLLEGKPESFQYHANVHLGGPPSCPADENACNAYNSV